MTYHIRCLLTFLESELMSNPWASWKRHVEMWGTEKCPGEKERDKEVLDER